MSSNSLPENNQATPGEGFNSESKRRWTAPSPLPVPRPPAGSLGSRADSVRVAQGLCSKDSRLPRGVTRVGAFRAAVCVNSCPASLPLSSPWLLHPSGCHFSYPSRVRTGGLRSGGPRAGRLGPRTLVSSHVWGWASAVAVWVAVYLPRPRGAVPLHVRVRASRGGPSHGGLPPVRPPFALSPNTATFQGTGAQDATV